MKEVLKPVLERFEATDTTNLIRAGIVRKELGGMLVYDSYAKMEGCAKLQTYFEENRP